MSTVPRPEAIVHDVAMFLLYPPQPEAAGREEWERARAAIAQLANSQCAVATPPPPAAIPAVKCGAPFPAAKDPANKTRHSERDMNNDEQRIAA